MLNPGFFRNELLAELPIATRMLFAGLWTLADKEGRLEDRPKRIKADLFPWDDVDVDAALEALAQSGFITRYSVNGDRFIAIPKFDKYQRPHPREAASEIPMPREEGLPKASPRQTLSAKHDEEGEPRCSVINTNTDPNTGRHALPARIGKKQPLPGYARLRVFEWMVNECLTMLGARAEEFDLDAYLIRLDSSPDVLPAELWPWLKEMVSAEAASRGLTAAKPRDGKDAGRRVVPSVDETQKLLAEMKSWQH